MRLLFDARHLSISLGSALLLTLAVQTTTTAQTPPDRWLVPAEIRQAILEEFSGELALQHVQLLAANRIRPEEEYTQKFFETSYLEEMATRYGLSDVAVDYFPSGNIWVPYEADLWMVAPVRKKIASLTMVPSALASNSRSADVVTEVVWVGNGQPADYEGIDVNGKIVMGSGSVSSAFSSGVNQRGAAGALGTGSPGVGGNYPGYSLDQIGWASVRPSEGIEGFGFNLSLRQFNEIRGLLEQGRQVVMRAHVKTGSVPYRMNVISAAIEGTDPSAGELIKVAHAFERIATPGANDNCSGVATILEIARTLQTLIDRGVLPRPRRTIRFLFVPEITGSRAFMYDRPELQDRLIAAMNYDMPGEDLELTDSWMRMKMTPDSHPSYLNDLINNLLLCTDQTDIRTQTGNNSPFNYRLVPFISSSDHVVFLSAGIPAMQFNHWTDNFYHSSGDRVEVSDPTEMKRSGFIGAASFYYLANAGEDEALDLAWEASANGEKWMAEVNRQAIRMLEVDGDEIHERHKAAQNKVDGAFHRAAGSVESVLDLADTPAVMAQVDRLTESLEAFRAAHTAKLEAVYRAMCADMGVRPQRITLTDLEREYSGMIPRYLYRYYSEEYQAASREVNQYVPSQHRLRGMASTIVPWSVDGERSILDIYNLARAAHGNVTTNSTEWKFAYAVTPETGDVTLEAVAGVILAMEQAGLVEIERK